MIIVIYVPTAIVKVNFAAEFREQQIRETEFQIENRRGIAERRKVLKARAHKIKMKNRTLLVDLLQNGEDGQCGRTSAIVHPDHESGPSLSSTTTGTASGTMGGDDTGGRHRKSRLGSPTAAWQVMRTRLLLDACGRNEMQLISDVMRCVFVVV